MKTYLRFFTKLISHTIFVLVFPAFAIAQWSAPKILSTTAFKASMNENMGQCIATSGDTVHVIWSDHRTKGYSVYYTRSIDSGLTWTTPVAITDTNGHASKPSLAVSGKNIHVVWWDTTKGIPSTFYKHSLDGGNTWSAKMLIDSNTAFWPGVAVYDSIVLISIDKMDTGTTVFLTKSTNNGANFSPEHRISMRVGNGRSEDQGMATDGKYIHMLWNDNRNGPLEIYYRSSKNMGATWGPELDLTPAASYSPMVFINDMDNSKVYGAVGFGSSPTNTWLASSVDTGNSFAPVTQVTYVTTSTETEAYPYMVCNGSNLFMVAMQFPTSPWQVWYLQSADDGSTWSAPYLMGDCNGAAFIAMTCPALHVIWPNNGNIYYSRNPKGSTSCSTKPTGISETISTSSTISLYPNPVNETATVMLGEAGNYQLSVYDVAGRLIQQSNFTGKKYSVNCGNLSPGVYFMKTTSEKGTQVLKFVKE